VCVCVCLCVRVRVLGVLYGTSHVVCGERDREREREVF
jgi:hypothetical protein